MSDPFDNNEDISLPQSDRLQILSPVEYELLSDASRFSQYGRILFFTLASPERHSLGSLKTAHTKANFLLQLGYFRSRQRFFEWSCRALSTISSTSVVAAEFNVWEHIRKRHVVLILKLFRYRLYKKIEHLRLEERAAALVRIAIERFGTFGFLVHRSKAKLGIFTSDNLLILNKMVGPVGLDRGRLGLRPNYEYNVVKIDYYFSTT